MYPTAIIVLIETQRSMADICEISPSDASRLAGPVASEPRPATLGHLFIAVETVHGNEAEHQRSCALQSQGGEEDGLEAAILESQVGTVSIWVKPL